MLFYRSNIFILFLLLFVTPVLAQEEKPAFTGPPNIPAAQRQGGDDVSNAFIIDTLPFNTTGSTTGFNNDYDVACPHEDSIAPDVVYSYTPESDIFFYIDLCGSQFDTKVYIFDSSMNVVGCNDDFYYYTECGQFVSYLRSIPLLAGETYFIVVDAYGDAHGQYIISAYEGEYEFYTYPLIEDYPWYTIWENEPPLVEGYVDEYNGGCNSEPPYQNEQSSGFDPTMGYRSSLLGQTGFYINDQGLVVRDTDWFKFQLHSFPEATVILEAGVPCKLYWVSMEDGCDNIEILGSARAGWSEPASLTVLGGTYNSWNTVVVIPVAEIEPYFSDFTPFEYLLSVEIRPGYEEAVYFHPGD